jgi:hypothetical protein
VRAHHDLRGICTENPIDVRLDDLDVAPFRLQDAGFALVGRMRLHRADTSQNCGESDAGYAKAHQGRA